ncbi:MAG: glycoside hydrolase family 3 N-terminal domain-containing protein [Thermodesulfovibrionales bacterium]
MQNYQQNYYQFIIPRLNGDDIKKEFSSHLSLAKKGIAGFIIFGGRLKEVRKHIRQLQETSELPLIIAADLERGLGQQLKGGTLFPPAMALAKAAGRKDSSFRDQGAGKTHVSNSGLKILRQSFQALAEEARYAGINTILAPVLDINTNPDNPIIGVRSFGEDSSTVSFFGEEMIRTLQNNGIATCGKHFPGHGDTAVDSHISLPSIRRSLASLNRAELRPFRKAVAAGVAMLMLGHLDVPALDSSGIPVSLSGKVVAYIRKSLHYKGLLITDAMNMGGLSGFSEEEASLMALRAGVDIILHPLHTERVAAYLREKAYLPHNLRLAEFRRGLLRLPDKALPRFEKHAQLSDTLTAMTLSLPINFRVRPAPLVVILSDEKEKQGNQFIEALRNTLPDVSCITLNQQRQRKNGLRRIAAMATGKKTVITAVFSETRAWKGQTVGWLQESIAALNPLTGLFVSFGNPYLINNIPAERKLLAYWNAEIAQRAAAEAIIRRFRT